MATTFHPQEKPTWFPFDIYAVVMTTRQLVGALTMRIALQAKVRNGVASVEELEKNFISLLSLSTAELEKRAAGLIGEELNQLAIRDQDIFEAAFLVAKAPKSTLQIQNLAKACADDRLRGLGETLAANLGRYPGSASGINEDDFFEVLKGRASLSVNLYADDETIKRDFEFWLAMAREGRPLKQFQEKDFIKWRDLRILAAFDLTLWADIHSGKYTSAFLGATLWPDDAQTGRVDTTERYRKLTAPKLEEYFHWGVVERLMAQDRSEVLSRRIVDALANPTGKEIDENLSGME